VRGIEMEGFDFPIVITPNPDPPPAKGEENSRVSAWKLINGDDCSFIYEERKDRTRGGEERHFFVCVGWTILRFWPPVDPKQERRERNPF
jgi:hypothetical protein